MCNSSSEKEPVKKVETNNNNPTKGSSTTVDQAAFNAPKLYSLPEHATTSKSVRLKPGKTFESVIKVLIITGKGCL